VPPSVDECDAAPWPEAPLLVWARSVPDRDRDLHNVSPGANGLNMLRVTGLGVLWLLWGVSASAAPDLEARFDLIPSLPLVAGVGLRTGRHDERRALRPVSSLSLCLVL
jgi:hypothetical protein